MPIFPQHWPAYFTNLCGLPQYFPDVFPLVYQYFPDVSSWCNLLPKRLGKCAAPNIGKMLSKYAETLVFLHILPICSFPRVCIFSQYFSARSPPVCIFSQSLGRRIGNLACIVYQSLSAAPIFSRCFPNSGKIRTRPLEVLMLKP